MLWHNYYLRGAMTYDSFFKEHILSQGHVYQYVFGFQGAARDPLQHALPFVYSRPEIAREVLESALATRNEETRANVLSALTQCLPEIQSSSVLHADLPDGSNVQATVKVRETPRRKIDEVLVAFMSSEVEY